MTELKTVMNFMLPLIPTDYKTEIMNDISFAEHGVIEMGVALGKTFKIVNELGEETTSVGFMQTNPPTVFYITPNLSPSEIYLASYFSYRTYLMNLKDSFNRDAINFKTLTFEIKSLEKRPEAINDSLYQLNRYLKDEVAKATGSSSIIGKATQFGGDTNE